jgi:DNA-binding transcriptional MerR regulator
MDLSEGFPTTVAAKLGKVTTKALEHWDVTGFLSPSVPPKRRGISARYSFRDVVAIRVVAELRAEGFSLQSLRKIVAYLCTRKGHLSPTDALASTRLVAVGRDVFEIEDDVVTISTLLRPGQRLLLMVPLGEVVAELQAKARALRAA